MQKLTTVEHRGKLAEVKDFAQGGNYAGIMKRKVVHLRGLDGDTPVLLILASVGEAGLSGLGAGDDSGLGDQGIRQGRLAVVNVSDDGHITDVLLLVHHATDLVYGEIHLKQRTPPLVNP